MYILADPCILYCPQRDVINRIKLGYQKKVIVSHSQKVNMFSDFFRSHKGENSYINRLCETLTVYANLHTQWQLYKQHISLILFSFWSQIYYLFGRNVKQPFLRLIVKDFFALYPFILTWLSNNERFFKSDKYCPRLVRLASLDNESEYQEHFL